MRGKLGLALLGLVSAGQLFAATLPTLNAASLKQYDGKNGHKSYVALNGKVYDVSNVEEWKGGKHYAGMVAGTDVTPYISKSPHGAGIIDDVGLKPVAIYSAK